MEKTNSHMLTAEEARRISGIISDDDEINRVVKSLLNTIQNLAMEKKFICKTGWNHELDSYFWMYEGYFNSKMYQKACQILEDLGFVVYGHYKNIDNHFTEAYTVIEWR